MTDTFMQVIIMEIFNLNGLILLIEGNMIKKSCGECRHRSLGFADRTNKMCPDSGNSFSGLVQLTISPERKWPPRNRLAPRNRLRAFGKNRIALHKGVLVETFFLSGNRPEFVFLLLETNCIEQILFCSYS